MGATNAEPITRGEGFTWFLGMPALLIVGTIVLGNLGMVGSQSTVVSSFSDIGQGASLRTNVGEACQAAMIELHGQSAWDQAVTEQAAIEAAGGQQASEKLTEEALAQKQADKIADAAPIGTGVAIILILLALVMTTGRGVAPSADKRPLIIGGIGLVLAVLVDILLIGPATSSGAWWC